MLRRALIALTLANLCLIPAWREVVDPGPLYYCYHTKMCALGAELTGLTLDALLLAALFFAGAELARRLKSRAARAAAYAAFLLVLLVPLNGLRIQSPALMAPALAGSLGEAGFGLLLAAVAAVAVLAAAAGVALWRFGLGRFARGAAKVVLVFAPFVAIAYAQSLWKVVQFRRALADQPPAAAAAAPGQPKGARVVWLIFDGMDYRAAFEKRPDSLRMPEFDRLRAESLFSTQAFPPAGATLRSIPALLTGRLVPEVKQTRPDDLAVRFDREGGFAWWGERPNVFTAAREAGVSSALAGNYHPYCRMFGAQLTQCFWGESVVTTDYINKRGSVAYSMGRAATLSFLSLPMLRRLGHEDKQETVEPALMEHLAQEYSANMEAARRIIVNPAVGLAFVHLPVPHPPAFYDRAGGRFDSVGRRSYIDGLALADRSLGELRRAMEEAGVWDSTAVIVSSDHWWRAREIWSPKTGDPNSSIFWTEEDESMEPPVSDYRVPFILKLPGRAGGAEYAPAFNTVLSHDLVLALLRGEVSTAEGVSAWLDSHRSFGVSPYNSVSSFSGAKPDTTRAQKSAGGAP